jgi:hypothetical protein
LTDARLKHQKLRRARDSLLLLQEVLMKPNPVERTVGVF